jgi:hypothetical protein
VDFRKRPKSYLLIYISYWVHHFRPPKNSHTETEEYLNSVIHDKLHYSNHQTTFSDIIEKFATFDEFISMGQGGI